MTRQLLLLAATLATAACASHTASPAAPVPAPQPAAVALHYAAGTGRYRLESQTHVEQDMMGQVNATDITTAALFTAAIAEAEGNFGVAITIDSLAIRAPAGAVDPADLTAARGKIVRLVFSPIGRPISITAPDSASVTLQQVAQGLREFLPALPAEPTIAETVWSDTTTTTTPAQSIALTVHLARQHRASWEEHGGARALHIATTATYTVSGSGEVQGQALELTGSGQSVSDAFVAASGVYLGNTVSDSALVNAKVINAGMVVPVRRRTHSSLTRLP